ncbi:MAG: rhodanese-like domain-containing protein [Hyphomicrobiaceae bacterium]
MTTKFNRRSLLASGLLFLLLGVGFWSYFNIDVFGSREPEGQIMSVAMAHEKARAGEITLVDVRYPGEWRKTGLPASGFAISMHQDEAKFVSELETAVGGDKSKPLAVICAGGVRTGYLQDVLRQNGFTQPINVAAGMLGGKYGEGWLKSNLPTRKWTGKNVAPPHVATPVAQE